MAYRAGIRTAAAVIAVAMVSAAGLAQAQPVTGPTNEHPNPFETINDHFKLPEGRTWGSTSAVDIDPDGTSIWVGERCGTNSCAESDLDPVLKFDKDGNLLKSFGGGMLIFPHGIHVDGRGNVWVTDAQGPRGRGPAYEGKGHAVFKFNPDGELMLTLGRPGVAGDGSGPLLNEPNDVLVAPNGDIFVAEGHSGQGAGASWDTVARVVKFDSQGNFIKSWGGIGTAPGQFRTPHGLAMDSRGRLFVADRGNVRIQIFDQDGNFIDQWKQFSRLSGIYIDADDNIYGADSESSGTSNPGWRRGIRIGSAVTGHVRFFIPDPADVPRGTTAAEGVAVDAEGNLYGAEVGPRQLVKYVRREQ